MLRSYPLKLKKGKLKIDYSSIAKANTDLLTRTEDSQNVNIARKTENLIDTISTCLLKITIEVEKKFHSGHAEKQVSFIISPSISPSIEMAKQKSSNETESCSTETVRLYPIFLHQLFLSEHSTSLPADLRNSPWRRSLKSNLFPGNKEPFTPTTM